MPEKFRNNQEEENPLYGEYDDVPTVEKIRPPKSYEKSGLKKEKSGAVLELEKENDAEKEPKDIVAQEIISSLLLGNINRAINLNRKYKKSELWSENEEIQKAAEECLAGQIAKGNFMSIIVREFNMPEDIVFNSVEKGLKETSFWVYNDRNKASSAIKEFNLPEDMVFRIIGEQLVKMLSERPELDNYFLVEVAKYKINKDLQKDIVQQAIIKALSEGRLSVANEIKNRLRILPDNVFDGENFKKAAEQGMIKSISLGDINAAEQIKDKFKLSDEVIDSAGFKNAAQQGIIVSLSSGKPSDFFLLEDKFKPSEEFLKSKEVLQAARNGIILNLMYRGRSTEAAVQIKEALDFPRGTWESASVIEALEVGIAKQLFKGDIEGVVRIMENFDASRLIDKNTKFEENIADIFAAAHIFCGINMQDAYTPALESDKLTQSDYARLFKLARKYSFEWQEETVAGPFLAGAEIFGYKRMLEYIERDGLSLHDATHTFNDILELFKMSGLSEGEFYGKVLSQVRMDDKQYLEGTAHHHLNAISQTANRDVGQIIEKVQEYKEIKRLQELVEIFTTPQAIFTSWNNLKRYSELEQLLGRTEILDELKQLGKEGKQDLSNYIETLAFHPDSKVNMSAVIQFWREPESFLAAEASHTPSEIQDRKKPSNYTNMPNLDLTATELRDALVEGDMDGLSVFSPLEVRYKIVLENQKSEPLLDLVHRALGSSKKGIEGLAKNSRKLFNELGKLLKPHGISVPDYLQGKPLPDGVGLSSEIRELIYNGNFGMAKPPAKTGDFVAKITQKSDPESAIAGDDTVNCMPFGDGKNTVYTFNLNTSQFVIRIVKGDGKERTIAQSVLTKDMDIKIPVAEVISKLQQQNGEHLEDVLPEDIVVRAPVYASCDNVEVHPNYKDEKYQQIIETIFRDFFREYMDRYSKRDGLNSKKMPIGQGYTDALSQLPQEVNTFAPQAPISYSDKIGKNVYMLNLESKKGEELIWEKQVKETTIQKRVELPLQNIKGLEYLTFEDTMKVSYLEGKIYSDNKSLVQFLSNVENGLIAKDINNAAKDRPNMSLKYTDENGKMSGYMLAWEGKLSDKSISREADEFFNEPCIYIIDLAADGQNRMAGGRLIQGFVELYKQNYLDKGKAMPIYAQARETTSYQIIKKQLDKLGEDTNFNFELIELPTYEAGKDTMHPIIIRPVAKN